MEKLGVYFRVNVKATMNLHPTKTGGVPGNEPGKLGEWRNGALMIQAIAINVDGADGFTVDPTQSSGGQAVASSGMS